MTVAARILESVGPGRHSSDGKGPLAVVIAKQPEWQGLSPRRGRSKAEELRSSLTHPVMEATCSQQLVRRSHQIVCCSPNH